MNTFEMIIVMLALTVLVSLVAIAIDWVGRPLRNRRFIPRIFRFDDEIVASEPVGVYPGPQVAVQSGQVRGRAEPRRRARRRSPGPGSSKSAFSETVNAARQERDEDRSMIATSTTISGPTRWHPGLALDARVAGQEPTVEVMAERFWRATAARIGPDSHFDQATRAAMAHGKAPQRRNPRTGMTESMQLVGLRSASAQSDVRMHWPDSAVDPWSAS